MIACGAAGIGAAIARRFAAEGAVVATADRAGLQLGEVDVP